MQMPGRRYYQTAAKQYRYGFNGKEEDDEVKGDGMQQDYGMRIYDTRLGRFLSVDPITRDYPWYTPYQFAGNKPIWATDLDGLEENTTSTYSKPPVVLIKPSLPPPATQLPPKLVIHQSSDRSASLSSAQIAKNNVRQENIPPKVVYTTMATLSPANLSDYQKSLSDATKKEIDTYNKLKGATMDPLAGQISLNIYVTAQTHVNGIVDHSKGIVEGIQNGNYWRAAGNGMLLGLDIAPFIPLKGAGTASKTAESFLYRFDTRAPGEIIAEGGFKAWGNDMNLFLHAEGTNIVNKTSGYVATSSDLVSLEKVIGNQKGYIYKIKMQNNGVNVNQVLGAKSPHPYESEIAVPIQIKTSDIVGFKPHK